MEFTLSLTKEDVEAMLSREFGHDVQLDALYAQREDQELPDVIDFNDNFSFLLFKLENLIAPKQKFEYNDTREYDMD